VALVALVLAAPEAAALAAAALVALVLAAPEVVALAAVARREPQPLRHR